MRNQQTFFENIFFSISDWSRCRVSESEIKSFRFSLFLVFLDIDIESLKIEINCNEKLCTYIYHKKNAIHRIVSILKTNRLISNAKEWKKIVQGLVFSLSPDETDKTKHISSSFVRNSHGQWVNSYSHSPIQISKFFSPWADENINEKNIFKLSCLKRPIQALTHHCEFKWPQNIRTCSDLIGLLAKIVTNLQIIIHYSHRHISKQTNLSVCRSYTIAPISIETRGI